ncbi:hypothetical protein CO656_28670, partial [Sinorhizobium sp. FG01]
MPAPRANRACAPFAPSLLPRQLTASPFRPLLDDGGDDAGAACKSRLRTICTFLAAVGSLRHRLSDRYSTMEATMPAPTVRPPSRIAKRSF